MSARVIPRSPPVTPPAPYVDAALDEVGSLERLEHERQLALAVAALGES